MQTIQTTNIGALPSAEGLCTMCVDSECCPMPQALQDAQTRPEDSIDQPSYEGHTLVWCPMYG